MTKNLLTTLALLSSAFLLVPACDLADKEIGTGNESGDGDGDGDIGACGLETVTIIDDNASTPTTFSRSVDEMLATAVGEYQGSIDWLPNDGPWAVAHAGITSPMRMDVIYAGGEVRLTEVAQHGDFPGGQLGGVPCSNWIEIDAELNFGTEDGLFVETVDIVLQADAIGSGNLSFRYEIDFATHEGELVAEDFDAGNASVEHVVVGMFFAGARADGSLTMEILDEDLGIAGAGLIADIESLQLEANSDCGTCNSDEFCYISSIEDDESFGFYDVYACTPVPEGCDAQDCECIAAATCPAMTNQCVVDEVLTLDCSI